MGINTASKEKKITLICAFILPMLLVLPAFAAVGIYPFGDKSLLIIDMQSEYIDYLAKMSAAFRGSGSLLRSWNMGMGLNMLGLIAFYTSSPFNIIIYLLPLSSITEAVFVVTLIKLGLAGMLFALYAGETFPEADRGFHVAFAVAYALSAYNIAYASNIMWLDGTAFLPLVLLGVENILQKGRYRLFLLSLVYVFFTSYYIGYMIGIFAFLYLTARYFATRNDMRAYARILPRFLGSAALAGGCCAFLLLPAFLNLRNGQSEMWNIPFEAKLSHPFVRLASKLLPGAYDSLTDWGLPNIYCTVLAVALCFLYFCAKAVPLREKLVFGGFLGFLLISFSCEFLNLAWHAFEDPTWYPARYSFVFSFLVLYLALRCASLLEQISRGEIIAAGILVLLLFVEIGINRFGFMRAKPVWTGLALVAVYTAGIVFWRGGNRRVLSALLVFFLCIEGSGNAIFMELGMDRQFGYGEREKYHDFMRTYSEAFERVKAHDSGVYRAEILNARNANGAMGLGYNGISHYSTTTDQELNGFLRDLGYNLGTINELRFSISTPLTNGLLGIKYVLSQEPMCEAYALLDEVDGVGVYENSAAWPMAFWAPESAAEFVPDSKNGPFELQNGLVRALTGEDITAFSKLDTGDERLRNAEKTVNGDHIRYERQIWNQDAAVEFEAMNPRRGEAFAFFPVYDDKFSGSEIFVGDEFAGHDFGYRSNTIIPLGNHIKSELRIVPDRYAIRVENKYFAALDLDAAKKAADKAAANQVEFTKFSDTEVEGKIIAPEDGLLATTFPYDKGWTLRIDGRRVMPTRLAGVFLAAPVSKGEHIISMRYLSPGFVPGLVISTVTIAGIFISFLLRKRNEK